MGERSACGKTTQELLLEFQQTGCQEPFEEIARRYAGMVYNVALQVTRDAHDAEDATQATFLSLAVHAKTAGKIRFVGPWLRKVSQRLALDIRRSKKRRSTREQRHAVTRAAANGNGDGTVSRHDLAIANSLQLEELRDILRNELDRLPTKYRMPLILYYFGGLTPDQIGKELKCKTSTLGVRLHRGRKMLADNLSRRGITINSATAGLMLAALVDTSIRDNLVHACAHAAVHVSNGHFIADATVSAPVLAMVNGVTRTIRLSRLKGLIAAALLLLTTITGTAKALEQLEIVNPELLQRLNPMRLIGPFMDRLVRPSFSLDVPEADDDSSPLTLRPDYSSLASGSWPLAGGTVWPQSPQMVTGMNAHVGSVRVLASQYHPLQFVPPSPPIPAATVARPVIAPPVGLALPQIAAAASESISQPAALPLSVNVAPSVTSFSPPPASVLPARTYDALVIDRSNPTDPTLNAGAALLFSEGSMHARRIVVGDATDGALIQTNGSIRVDEAVVIGNQPLSSGTYSISNDSTLTTPKLVVGAGGTGAVFQSGGQVVANTADSVGQVVLGDESGSAGTYVMEGGSLRTDQLVIGRMGTGFLQQSGGELQFQVAFLGLDSGGRGTWSLTNGSVKVSDPTSPANTNTGGGLQVAGGAALTSAGATPSYSGAVATPTGSSTGVSSGTRSGAVSSAPIIKVGGEGSGTFLVRSNSVPAIGEQAGTRGTTLLVQPDGEGTGVVRGWGRIELTGPLVLNGRVIADGFGQPRTLDLSSTSMVANTVDNPPEGGLNGWYARNGGSLKLPPVRVYGAGQYTWGEFIYDRQIDLVNSVRFTIKSQTVGEVEITLLDPLSRVVPLLSTGTHGMALWEMDGTMEFSGIDLLVRYDEVMAGVWQVSESELVLWAFEDGQWRVLSDEGSGIDTALNLIWGRAQNPEFFAVGLPPDNFTTGGTLSPSGIVVTPEPSGLAALALLAAVGLGRRRRR